MKFKLVEELHIDDNLLPQYSNKPSSKLRLFLDGINKKYPNASIWLDSFHFGGNTYTLTITDISGEGIYWESQALTEDDILGMKDFIEKYCKLAEKGI